MGLSALIPLVLRITPGPSPLHELFSPILLGCGLVFIVSFILAFHAFDIASEKAAEKPKSSD